MDRLEFYMSCYTKKEMAKLIIQLEENQHAFIRQIISLMDVVHNETLLEN